MKKILFLAVTGMLFASSTAMAQNNYNNCDGSCLGNQRNFTMAQNGSKMQERGTYRNNDNYRGNSARQMKNSQRYMSNKGNCRHNNNYNNGQRGQGRMNSNW